MAIFSSISEEAKSAIDDYMRETIERNEIAPLEYIMLRLKYMKVVIDERSVINYVEANYPGYLVIDFEPYLKLFQQVEEAIGTDDIIAALLVCKKIFSKDFKFIE